MRRPPKLECKVTGFTVKTWNWCYKVLKILGKFEMIHYELCMHLVKMKLIKHFHARGQKLFNEAYQCFMCCFLKSKRVGRMVIMVRTVSTYHNYIYISIVCRACRHIITCLGRLGKIQHLCFYTLWSKDCQI